MSKWFFTLHKCIMQKQKTRKQSKKIRGGGCGSSKIPCKQNEDINKSQRGNRSNLPKFYTSSKNYKSVMKNIEDQKKENENENKPFDPSFPTNSTNSLSQRKTIRRRKK
jgi:hypothetical protein